MKRFVSASVETTSVLFLQLQLACLGASLCLLTLVFSGCDMGTYNRRLKEPPSIGQSAGEETGENGTVDDENVDNQQP